MREKIGHYTVVSELGRGGMGIVYKAHEESLNRFVAIKVLTERLTEDDTFLQRFVREAKAAAGVSHPNITQIYYIGEDEGHPYFVMEYVSGQSLSQMLREKGQIGNPRASQLILQAAHGLAAAHDLGIVHRDIKPANLILDERGMVKIADFGLALPAAAETRLTATGMMVGTPGYLAPEQVRGEAVDYRTDIYALGVTFYELLAGAPPFRGESPLALMRQILDEQPPDVGSLNPDIDDETRRILGKMIEKDREKRYQSCHEIVADLEDYLAKRGVRSMTAGLATRKPSTAELAAAAAAMPTMSLATPAGKTAITEPGEAMPTQLQSTEPGAFPPQLAAPPPTPSAVAPTVAAAPPVYVPPTPAYVPPAPGYVPPTPAYVPPPPPAQRSSSRATILVVILVVLLGCGVAAAFLGMRLYNGWKAGKQLAAATTDTTAAVTTAPPSNTSSASAMNTSTVDPRVMLTQGVNTSTVTGNGEVTSSAPISQQGVPTSGGVTRQDPVTSTPSTTTMVTVQRSGGPVTGVVRAGVGGVRQSPQQIAQNRPIIENVAPQASRGGARALSGVGVAVTGDRALLSPISSVLTSELEAAGVQAVDTQTLPSTEDLVRRGDASAGRLIDRLRAEGLAVLVLARVDPVGQRELNYMGRSDTAYSARITLTTYDVATGRPFGSSRSASIEYTSATADRESEKVIGPLARAIAPAIQGH